MFRVGLVVLLIAAVLACPYRCAARTAMAIQQTQTKRSCACCAKTCRPNPSDTPDAAAKLPQLPTENDNTCVCVCDGAIISASPIVCLAELNWFDGQVLADQLTAFSAELLAYGHRPPDCIETGLDLRLSMRSLLL